MVGLRTPSDMPNVAMMKANSPICVSEKPDWMATLRVCPVTSMPKVPKSIIPTITTDDRMRICHQYMATIEG